MSHIGTLNEKSLHAQLKVHYSQPGDRQEVPLKGFVIDIVRGDDLIEIQTRQIGRMKNKLRKLLPDHKIRVIFPIAKEKWIIKTDPITGLFSNKRKSPKKGSVYDIFGELVGITDLLEHPNLTLHVAMIQEEEVRRFDPKRQRRRRRGWMTAERKLKAIVAEHIFDSSADFAQLLPEQLPDPFDTAILAKKMGQPRQLAQKIVYCLRNTAVLEQSGKRGNALLYRRIDLG